MGTQTLIQALHAIPWQESADGVQDKDDSDENDADKPSESVYICIRCCVLVIDTFSAFALSSSIHTIHRPMARIRRRSTAVTTASSGDSSIEEEEGDFDPHVLSGQDAFNNVSPASPRPHEAMGNAMMRRSTSLATVKVQRRAKLAEKLKEVFDVKELQEVIAGLSPLSTISSGIAHSPSIQKCLVGF
jgi:sterol 3beta-glucosyltransferase